MFKRIGLLLMLSSLSVQADMVRIDAKPINITLPVGIEKIIELPEQGEIGYDKILLDGKIRIDNLNKLLYFTALEPFSKTRVLCKLNSGRSFFIDLRAKQDASQETLMLVYQNPAPNNQSTTPERYASVLKHAISQLYSPKRLIAQDFGFRRVPLRMPANIHLIDGLVASPVATWKSHGLYVSAIALKNISKKDVKISLSDIRGDILASSIYPGLQLDANNTDTTIFLVTQQPLGESLV